VTPLTPYQPRLVVVTATTDVARAATFIQRLSQTTTRMPPPVVVVQQKTQAWMPMLDGVVVRSDDYLGVVPAFTRGVEMALRAYPSAEVIACLHDDVLMQEYDWDHWLLRHFDNYPSCGLAGFGGAWGLGDVDAGKGEYRPTWLVRRGFMSNMPDAEVHGERSRIAQQVAVLDGFSLCFRRDFLIQRLPTEAWGSKHSIHTPGMYAGEDNLFALLEKWGVVHHAYDAAMGAFAKDLGWEVWYLPFECQHLGGQTAVGDAGYAEWAKTQTADSRGDQRFWEEAHGIIWSKLGHLLPFEVGHRT